MWGLRSPTPRGRTESCTLHILTDVLQMLTGKGERHSWRKKKEVRRKKEKMSSLRPHTTPVAQPHLYKLCRRVRCHPAFLIVALTGHQPLKASSASVLATMNPCLIFTVNNFFLRFDFHQNPPSKPLFLQ